MSKGLAVIGVAEVPTKRDPERTRWDILLDVCIGAIRDAGIDKALLEHPGLSVRSIQDCGIRTQVALVDPVAQATDNEISLVSFVVRGVNPDGFALGAVCP